MELIKALLVLAAISIFLLLVIWGARQRARRGWDSRIDLGCGLDTHDEHGGGRHAPAIHDTNVSSWRKLAMMRPGVGSTEDACAGTSGHELAGAERVSDWQRNIDGTNEIDCDRDADSGGDSDGDSTWFDLGD